MAIETVAIVAPGDMGHALGMRLRQGGLRVVTNLAGRSDMSRRSAAKAGMIDLKDDGAVVGEAEVFLSVVPPGRALAVAKRFAKPIKASGRSLLYVDLNATSPTTARQIEKVVTAAGARFVDGGIIGGAPSEGAPLPRIMLSGGAATEILPLNERGLKFFAIGPHAGQASGLKICYASISKGLIGLGALAFVSARVMGVDEALRKEMERGDLMKSFERRFPNLGPDAYRWAEEMDQIAETFAAAGMTPTVFKGMAELCRFIDKSPLSQDTKENIAIGHDMEAVVRVLAEKAQKRKQPKKSVRKRAAK